MSDAVFVFGAGLAALVIYWGVVIGIGLILNSWHREQHKTVKPRP